MLSSEQRIATEIEKVSYSMGILFCLEQKTESFLLEIVENCNLKEEEICFIFKQLVNKHLPFKDIFGAKDDIIRMASDGISVEAIFASVYGQIFDR